MKTPLDPSQLISGYSLTPSPLIKVNYLDESATRPSILSYPAGLQMYSKNVTINVPPKSPISIHTGIHVEVSCSCIVYPYDFQEGLAPLSPLIIHISREIVLNFINLLATYVDIPAQSTIGLLTILPSYEILKDRVVIPD